MPSVSCLSCFVVFLLLVTVYAVDDFKCPEQFGYYPDEGDCSKYFVCVFGDPLHESCTGGLYFSVELQTCDWPRNVQCAGPAGASGKRPPAVKEGPMIPPNRRFVASSRSSGRNRQVSEVRSRANPVTTTTTTQQPPSTTTRSPTTYDDYQSLLDDSKRIEVEEPTEIPLSVEDNKEDGAPPLSNSYDPQQPQYEEAVPPVVDSEGGIHVADGGRPDKIPPQKDDALSVFVKPLFRNSGKSKDKEPDQVFKRDETAILAAPNPREEDVLPVYYADHRNKDVVLVTYPRERFESYGENSRTFRPPSNRARDARFYPRTRQNLLTQIPAPPPPTQPPIQLKVTKQPQSYPSYHDYDNYNLPSEYAYADDDLYEMMTTTQRPRRYRTTTTTTTPRPSRRPLPKGFRAPGTRPPAPPTPASRPARPRNLYATPAPLETAQRCDSRKCRLPDCHCGGSEIPGGLPSSEVPQVVLLTFDDAVNDLNFDHYTDIFDTGRKNPNGCPIRGTFYVSHEWTDYGQVQTLYSKGHELASHTVTHSFGEKFSKNQWFKEVAGQREILHLFGGVKLEDIRGMRAPFLQIGGNKMFEMLHEANFTYDSSMPVFENNPPFWPYTLDYAINHECMITPCPSKTFPGVWEVGMVMWVDLRGGRCSMGDACSNPGDEDGVHKMLLKNFNRHYKSNRAPFNLFYHSAWFNTQHHKKGFLRFLDHILSKGDVWIITNWQLIQWMRDPTPNHRINSFEPWQCRYQDRPDPCHHPTVCNVPYQGGLRYMKTCQPCPDVYPWVGNTGFGSKGSR